MFWWWIVGIVLAVPCGVTVAVGALATRPSRTLPKSAVHFGDAYMDFVLSFLMGFAVFVAVLVVAASMCRVLNLLFAGW